MLIVPVNYQLVHYVANAMEQVHLNISLMACALILVQKIIFPLTVVEQPQLQKMTGFVSPAAATINIITMEYV